MKTKLILCLSLAMCFNSISWAESEGEATEVAAEKVDMVEAVTQAAAQANAEAIAKQSSLDVEVAMCFPNEKFKALNGDSHLANTIDRIKQNNPNAVDDRGTEVCVVTGKVSKDREAIDELKQHMSSENEKINLEVLHPILYGLPNASPAANRVILTLRGAALGAVGALAARAINPPLRFFSDKGNHENLSLARGAVIGALADLIQHISGRTDEKSIALTDAGVSLLAGLLNTKDPSVAFLGLTVALSQTAMVRKINEMVLPYMPKKLDWKIPLLLTGVYVGLSRKFDGADKLRFNKDKIVEAGTYGSLAGAVTLATGNESLGYTWPKL